MLIDVSYFTSGPRHIMNATAATMPQQNSLSVNAAIVGYIKHYQLAFLCELLGDSMAVAMEAPSATVRAIISIFFHCRRKVPRTILKNIRSSRGTCPLPFYLNLDWFLTISSTGTVI